MARRQRAVWESVPARPPPPAPWWAKTPAAPPAGRAVNELRPLCASDVAKVMLRDFARSGVDEDLERLRSAWHKPPTPPLSSDDDDEFASSMKPPRSRSGRRRPKESDRPRWYGPLDTDQSTAAAAAVAASSSGFAAVARPLPSAERVHSGALDFRSEQRLEMISNLRRLATSGAAAPHTIRYANR